MGEKNGGKGKALAPEGKTSVRGELLEVGDILLDQLQQLAAVDHFLHSLDVGPDLTVDLEEGDLLIEVKQKEGFFTVNDNGVTVALDTTLTDELIAEGFVRELISKVQTMRKEAGFVVTDHIAVSVCGSEKVESIVKASPDELTSSVLCDKLVFEEKIDSDLEKEWDINGENVTISVKKL